MAIDIGNIKDQARLARLSSLMILMFVIYLGIKYMNDNNQTFDIIARVKMRELVASENLYSAVNGEFTDKIEKLSQFEDHGDGLSIEVSTNKRDWSAKLFHPLGDKTFCYASTGSGGAATLEGTDAPCPVIVVAAKPKKKKKRKRN